MVLSVNIPIPQPPVDADHSLRIGWVAAALATAKSVGEGNGILTDDVRVLADELGYLDTVEVVAPSGTYRVTVSKVA